MAIIYFMRKPLEIGLIALYVLASIACSRISPNVVHAPQKMAELEKPVTPTSQISEYYPAATAMPIPTPNLSVSPTPDPKFLADRSPRKIDLGSGKTAQDFEIELIDGRVVNLSNYRGKVVVLNFWGTWCPPCRAEMPALQRIWEEYKEKEVIFLGIAIYDESEEVKEFSETYGITYPLGVDLLGQLTVAYRVTNFPTTFLIDRDGNEVRRIVNPVNEGLLKIFLRGMLRDS
jgi:peroxiredoxin